MMLKYWHWNRCTDGACAADETLFANESHFSDDFIKLPYGQGGDFEGMGPHVWYHESLYM